jgi:hypothetical protein
MFGHGLRCDTVPRLIINFDPSIKLAEKIVALAPVLLQLRILGLLEVAIVISFGRVISVKFLLVRFKINFCVLNGTKDRVFPQLKVDLV